MKEHKNYKILIAEDAPVQGKRLKYFLEKYHYKVDWVTNGKEALDRLKHRNDYALIISDYKMPIMDGIQLLENLKGFDDLSRIPFILLTTFNDDELFLKTLALGANEFLSKPFRPEELKVRVENMVLLYEYQIAIEAQNMNLSSELETKNVLLKQKLIDLKNAYVRQKEMQNELVLRSKMASLGTMGAGVAHEINNPLTIINSYNSMLRRYLEQDKIDITNLSKVNEKIEDAVRRISDVINQLQLLSIKGSTDKAEVGVQSIDKLLVECREFIDDDANREGIKVSIDYNAKDSFVYADRGVLKQIFLSIIHNAIDAMLITDVKLLTVRTWSDKFVHVEIEDSGTGIAPDMQSRVFDPFFTTKSPNKGMGLGMTLVKTYIQECQGHISFTSEPGKTVFKLKFIKHQED